MPGRLTDAYKDIKQNTLNTPIFIMGYPRVMPEGSLLDTCPLLLLFGPTERSFFAEATTKINLAGLDKAVIEIRFESTSHFEPYISLDWAKQSLKFGLT